LETFFLSDEFQSVYSFWANVKSQTVFLNATHKRDQQLNIEVGIRDFLPENQSLYLRRFPPPICRQPGRINFHLDVLSLDSVDEIAMVSDFSVLS